MDQPVRDLRILMLEDVPSDAALEEAELRDAGLVYTLKRVDTRAAFEAALDEFRPDIVIADYRLPNYNGREAVEYARRTHPQIPVIMVTGAMGDESAVELLRLGAKDYVLKDRLARLAPAIKRVLSEEQGVRNRKLAEANVRESEARFRGIFENARDAIITLSVGGVLSTLSPSFETITGWSREEWQGRPFFPLIHPDELPTAMHLFQRAMRGEALAMFELRVLKKSGDFLNAEFTIAPLTHEGKVTQLLGIARDISERKKAEAILRERERQISLIYETVADVIFDLKLQSDGSYFFASVNPCFVATTGLQRSQIVGKTVQEVIPEPSLTRALEKYEESIREHKIVRWEETSDYPAGRLTGDVSIAPVFDEAMNCVGLVGSVHDITGRKRGEEELRRANRALQALSTCNMALLHASDESWLLNEICRIVVEVAGYRVAWVGLAEHDAQKTVRPVAHAGHSERFINHAKISWGDTPSGQGPAGAAIRTQQAQIVQDAHADPQYAPWRDIAVETGYRSVLCLPLILAGTAQGALCIYSADRDGFDSEEVALLTELANDLSFGIVTLRTRADHRQSAERLRRSMESIIEALAGTLELRDAYTAGHQRRVAELATAIAGELGFSEDEIHGIRLAGVVHDLGKIQVPSEILAKPAQLSKPEYELVKTHAQAGYDILKDIDFPWPIAQLVYQHHERIDGSGYPRGLRGEEILGGAKILAVADVVEAMSSHRPYRPGLGIPAALAEIEKNRGTLYDAAAVDACLKLFREQRFAFTGGAV